MKTLTKLSLPVAFTFLFTACNDVQFTGGSAQRANSRSNPSGEIVLSCEVKPASVKVGSEVEILVSANRAFDGALIQTIKRSGKEIGSFELVAEGDVIKRKDDSANKIKADELGKYEIEVAGGSNVKAASCGFEAKKEATTPAPVCKPTDKKIGGNIAFLIDNSNSNAATDCENPVKIGTLANTNLYECQAETNREKAVKAAFEALRAIAAQEPESSDAQSRIAIASFPTRNDYEAGWEVRSSWLETISDNQDTLADAMLFARKPLGLTPYDAAFTAGMELFDGLDAGKQAKVAVLVTDGEPTDANPKSALAKADELRAQGVKVITVFVTGKASREERQATHRKMMEKINDAIDPWFDTAAYDDFDSYIKDIFGLASAVSDGKVVEVEDSTALKQVFLDIIGTEVVQCEND